MPKVAIVLTNGYADWECAFINGIGSAYYGIETVNVTPDGDDVVSQGGLRTIPDSDLSSINSNEFDMLVLCGGTIWETGQAPDMREMASSFILAKKHVAAICGGTLGLADTGLLDDRSHTSNALEFLTGNSKVYKGKSRYVNSTVAILDNNVITAPGNAPAHFTAAVFTALGVDEKTVSEFLGMLSKEHMQDKIVS